MKKLLKIAGILIGVVILLVIGFVSYLKIAGMPSVSAAGVHRPNVHVESTPVKIERGRKIVTLLCYDCHFNPATNRLSGHFLPELPSVFGKIYSHNITNDKTYGIGGWSDGEIMYFLRTGIHKNNDYIPPYMPKFPNVAQEDIESIIAFLRSGDSLVAPIAVKDTAAEPSILTLFLSRFVFKPLPYPDKTIPPPPAGDQVAVGRYWANGVVGCYQCHSADFKTNDELNPEKSTGFYGGGNELADAMGKPIYSANLTPHGEFGLGKWSQENFLHALRDGLRQDNTALRYPMARFPQLTDSEIVSIYAYLKTVPTLANPRKQGEEYKLVDASPSAGQKVYYKYACYACHGQNGVGMCDLTVACQKYHNDEDLISWIKNPSKFAPGTKMPSWEGTIKEEEYPALAQYIRQLGQQKLASTSNPKPTASSK